MRGMNDTIPDNSYPEAGADGAVPFARLTPETVLDAIDGVLATTGVRTDGRLLPLNSYENRVYQVGVEDGPPVVAKFYRPERWSDAADSRRARVRRRTRRARDPSRARARARRPHAA
ncbi:Ser/Thr protein kinase RdoA (MazF antagonist) [Paraburkholderia sp. WSM4174]